MKIRLAFIPRLLLIALLPLWLASPSFAQHGGGGHGGGGGHFGGGGGGHFGGAPHASIPSGPSGGGMGVGPRVAASGSSGYVPSHFVAPPRIGTATQDFGGNRIVSPSSRFVAPSSANSLRNRPNLILGGPPGGYPIRNFPRTCAAACGVYAGSFFPNYYGFAPAFGLVGFGWGWGGFAPWGYGFGLWDPWGYGYYDWNNPVPPGSYYDQNYDQNYDQTPDANAIFSNDTFGNSIYEALAPPAADVEEPVQAVYPVIVLKDGTSYAVTDYWLSGGHLHYITTYGGENDIDINQLDLQKTVDENARRGINFTLRPTPMPEGQPDSQQDGQPGSNPPGDGSQPQ